MARIQHASKSANVQLTPSIQKRWWFKDKISNTERVVGWWRLWFTHANARSES